MASGPTGHSASRQHPRCADDAPSAWTSSALLLLGVDPGSDHGDERRLSPRASRKRASSTSRTRSPQCTGTPSRSRPPREGGGRRAARGTAEERGVTPESSLAASTTSGVVPLRLARSARHLVRAQAGQMRRARHRRPQATVARRPDPVATSVFEAELLGTRRTPGACRVRRPTSTSGVGLAAAEERSVKRRSSPPACCALERLRGADERRRSRGRGRTSDAGRTPS